MKTKTKNAPALSAEPKTQVVLPKVAKLVPEMSDREKAMRAEIEKLKAENEAMRTRSVQPLRIKIQDQPRVDKDTGESKPASYTVSIYGLGRFPVTLYKEQWRRLLAFSETINQFLNDNDKKIPNKADRE